LLAGAAADEVFFFAGAFAFGATDLVLVAPVIDFLAGARFAAVFFAGAAGLVVFFEVVLAFFTGLAAGLAAGFVAGLDAAFFAGADGLVGFAFSFAESEVLFLGASLTLPEGPFGRTNVPFSAPYAMERLILLMTEAVTSILYLSSMYFLIVGLLTPVRSPASAIHSRMISANGGCADILEAAVLDLVAAFGLEVADFLDLVPAADMV